MLQVDFRDTYNKYYKCTEMHILFQDASRDADKVLSLDPTNTKAILGKAKAQYSLGNFEKSLVTFVKGKVCTLQEARCQSMLLGSHL